MTKALLIPADTTAPVQPLELTKLEDYQRALGGWVEAVGANAWTAWLDEEGKIKGKPVNDRAHALLHSVPGLVSSFDVIVGDALITGLPDEEGDDTDVPAAILERFNVTADA